MTSQTSNDTVDAGPLAEPIAVIGLACRVPGAGDARTFWRNLVDGVESLRTYTMEEQRAADVPPHILNDPNFVPAAMVLDDHDTFDAAFFSMSIREAEIRDPQHRLFLELAHTALEDAGYDSARYPDDIGVYGGVGPDVYQWTNIRSNPRAYANAGWLAVMVGNHPDYCSTLTSYKLDLRGPSVTLHTACSTSLVAVHVACEALRNGECDMALTGGATIEVPAGHGYVYDEDGIVSPDGHCRAFDAAGGGTIWGSGGGVVVLKRLADALDDGDHVRAVIRGNAINNDGSGKVGFSAPSMEGQAAVIAQSLGVADIDPRTVTYVEAHGTGTALGDPIEVAALTNVYQQGTTDRGWCSIGSVKTNIGHLGQSAGIVGFVKAVLALEHGWIPPSLHYRSPNPKIPFGENPFRVAAQLARWETDGVPRRAGVSSFGIGGTNAHVVLEQAPATRRQAPDPRPAELLQLSARSESALATMRLRLADALSDPQPDAPSSVVGDDRPDVHDVAYTLRVGRREMKHRVAVVARDRADAAAALADPARLLTGVARSRAPRLAWLFSGQGAQYAGMGAELYETEPVFRDAVDHCTTLLRDDLDVDLRRLILADGAPADADEILRQTAHTQPALFTVEWALAQLWRSWGVEPDAMIGHSIGEYVAATVAGVFDLPDALHLVAARGRLMQRMPAGAMLAVTGDADDIRHRLPDGLAVCVVNGPGTCVVGGPHELVERFAGELERADVGSSMLRTSHAFHSPMMDPILGEFQALAAATTRRPPTAPFASNVTGTWISEDEATDPSYWARHLREAVRYGDCVATLLSEGEWLFVECGPGRQLCGLTRLQLPAAATPPVPSLPSNRADGADHRTILAAAGTLWAHGIAITPDVGAEGRRVPLPTYPWERQRAWIEPEPGAGVAAVVPDMSDDGRRRPVDEWFATPVWQQLTAGPVPASEPGRCLAFVDDGSQALADALTDAGAETIVVRPGDAYTRHSACAYTVRPADRADHDALLADLAVDGGIPSRMVHAWTAGRPAQTDRRAQVWGSQDLGFFALLALTQALAAAVHPDDVDLTVFTTGTQDVTGHDLAHPEHATVAGIVRVVPLELTWLRVRHVDLDGVDGSQARAAVDELWRTPARDDNGLPSTVALRAGRRWVQRYEPVAVPQPDDPAAGLRERGVYLITGGLGGIGITLAESLARRVRARLVLLSRSALPPREQWDAHAAGTPDGTDRTGRAIAAIRRIEAAGGEVLTVAGDVTDAGDVRRVREEILTRFGAIDGIVHAAGIPGGGMAEIKERAVAEGVIAPKVLGTLALEEVFGDLDLDVVVLCSSVTALIGGFGQVDYCAANSYLDAYARNGHGWRARVVSTDWGGWRDVGMAAEVDTPAGWRAVGSRERTHPVDHPVVTTHHAGAGGDPGWCGGIVSAATHWVLDEHRMSPVPVMPGTGYVEIARAAASAALPRPDDGQVLELRDLAFVEPMPVADGVEATLRVEFFDDAGDTDFQISSRIGEQVRTHARGTAAWTAAPAPRTVDVEAIQDRCTRADGRGGVPLSSLLTYGPHWRNLQRWYMGDGEALALLEANGIVQTDLDRWGLHPGMLDEATSFARLSVEGHYLPLGYGRLTMRRPLPARMWSHLQFRDSGTDEVVTADVTLYDEDGREVVAITDYVLRRIDPDAVLATVASSIGAASGPPPAAPVVQEASDEDDDDDGGDGIAPAKGAEAFHRLLAAPLGAQVVVSATALETLAARIAAVNQDTVEADLDASDAAPVSATTRTDLVAPRTELETTIARLWTEVLGGEVSVEDDFFELGGNSLIAVQLIALMRKEVGVRLPMRSLFEEPTVAGVAALVEHLRDGEPSQDQAEPDQAEEQVSIPRLPRRAR